MPQAITAGKAAAGKSVAADKPRQRAIAPAGKPARAMPSVNVRRPSRFRSKSEYGQACLGGQPSRPATSRTRKRHDEWVDITWALINSDEFLYRH